MQGPKGLDGDVQQVTFTASIPQEMTKAAADNDGAGASVNRCIMEIYYDGSLFKRDIQPVTHGTAITATFSAQVVANRTYTVVFWADCVADATAAEGLATDQYYTTNADGGLQAIALKGTYAGNDDKRDAFFAKESCTVAQAGTSFNITLKRPFAQINVITTDWDKVADVSNLKPDKVDVTINSPLSKFNAVTGAASADASVTSLNYNADLYTTPASGTDATLSMDYLFASADKAVIDIAWKAQKTDNADISHSFTNIPYQRNYRTNIKVALLTTTGQWTVTVDPTWETPEFAYPESKKSYLCFTALEADAKVGMTIDEGCSLPHLVYSTDGGANWTTSDWKGTSITLTNSGDKVYFKAGELGNTQMPCILDDDIVPAVFTTTGNLKVSGNIMYLLNGSNPPTTMTNDNIGCFCGLFSGTTITDASELELPVMSLALGCYCEMFCECESLTVAPALPATTLSESCYSHMFCECTSLEIAPTLPAETLQEDCYLGMFSGCSKLSSVTMLATETGNSCTWHDCIEEWLSNAGTNASSPTLTVAGSITDIVTEETPGERIAAYTPSNWTIKNETGTTLR